MKRLVLLSALPILAACGAQGASAPQAAAPAVHPVAPTVAETSPMSAEEILAAAVEGAAAADSYRFRAMITLAVAGTTTDAVLSGWVDGPDRQLTVGSGKTFVTTRVVDGEATVERGGVTTPVALAEAGRAPSFELLGDLEDVTIVSPTMLAGRMEAAALGASGFGDGLAGAAEVSVRIKRSGALAGYTLTAADESWKVSVDLSGFGEAYSH